jgi:hypothetical protein
MKWKNINNKEGRKNYGRLKNKMKRATDKAKKEYLESVCDGTMEFQRTGHYDLMQWYSTFFVRVPPHIIFLRLCTPRVVDA